MHYFFFFSKNIDCGYFLEPHLFIENFPFFFFFFFFFFFDYLLLITPTLSASEKLCFVIVAFSGYLLHVYFFFIYKSFIWEHVWLIINTLSSELTQTCREVSKSGSIQFPIFVFGPDFSKCSSLVTSPGIFVNNEN